MEASAATGWQGKRGERFREAQKKTDAAALGEVGASLRVQRIYGLVWAEASGPDSNMTPILPPHEECRPATAIDRRRFITATAAAIPMALLGQAATPLSAVPVAVWCGGPRERACARR